MKVLDAYPWVSEAFAGVTADNASGSYVSADCPLKCHRNARLSLWLGSDGRLLFGCWAGCDKLEILRAVGRGWKDCYPAGEMPDRPPQRTSAVYPYRDEAGVTLYQTVRLEPGTRGRDKDFRQRRPNAAGGWDWSLGDVRRVLYRLPEILGQMTETVCVVAGEKDADSLSRIGILATTNVCGERSPWLDSYSAVLSGRDVVVVPDADPTGTRHADEVVGSLVRHGARSVRVVTLPDKDATAFLNRLRRDGVTADGDLAWHWLLMVNAAAKWVGIPAEVTE